MSTTNDVISIYNSTGSMKAVHKETGLSETKIRKILITEGLYSSELGDEIQRLYESGISFEEICKKVKRNRSCVNSYIPYTKGEYNLEDATENAKRVRKCRENKKEITKNE